MIPSDVSWPERGSIHGPSITPFLGRVAEPRPRPSPGRSDKWLLWGTLDGQLVAGRIFGSVKLEVVREISLQGASLWLGHLFKTWATYLSFSLSLEPAYLPIQPFRIRRNLSAFEPCIPHSSQHNKYDILLRNHTIYRMSRSPPNGCQVSSSARCHGQKMICGLMLYTIVNVCQCAIVRTERRRLQLRQETDRWIDRGRAGRLWKVFRENTKTFMKLILRHVRDDSGFRQN